MSKAVIASKGPKRPKWSDRQKQEMKARLRLSEVIQADGVKLRRQGREFVGLSPFGAERTPSFTVNDDKQFYHCFSSGRHGDVFDWLMFSRNLRFAEALDAAARLAVMEADGGAVSGRKGPEIQVCQIQAQVGHQAAARAEAEKKRAENMRAYARSLWQAGRPARGSLVEKYLRIGRQIPLDECGQWWSELRFHPSVRNRSGEWFAAMLARVLDKDGRFAAVHVTFLNRAGTAKISVPRGSSRAAKQIFGRYFGGAVRLLGSRAKPGAALYIGEGIESVLAARVLLGRNGDGAAMGLSGACFWAAGSLGNLVGAQARDGRGGLLFEGQHKRGRKVGLALKHCVLKPVPDVGRPGFALPEKMAGSDVHLLADNDLKDDVKRGLSGRVRAAAAMALAEAKFYAQAAGQVAVHWPPVGMDFQDFLVVEQRKAGFGSDRRSKIGALGVAT